MGSRPAAQRLFAVGHRHASDGSWWWRSATGHRGGELPRRSAAFLDGAASCAASIANVVIAPLGIVRRALCPKRQVRATIFDDSLR